MPIEVQSESGVVVIADDVIAEIVGVAAAECPGVVGAVSKKKIKDGVSDLLKKENHKKGVVVTAKNNEFEIDIHIVVLYGIRISEVAQSLQSKVKQSIHAMLGLDAFRVNIFVEDVKLDNIK